MFKNKTPISKNAQDLLVKKLLLWNKFEINNPEESFYFFFDDTEYLLKMLWLGRLDKLNQDDKALNTWISENYIPSKYNFDKEQIKNPQLVDIDISHHELAKVVLQSLWKDYLESDLEFLPKPQIKKEGFFNKFFGKKNKI